jgi:ubiquinone/menaquinone biosynthesis C-methylase UbiE
MIRFLPYQMLIERVTAALNPSYGFRILDAGCGTGELVQYLLRIRPDLRAVGIDFSETMLKRARAKLKHTGKATWLRVGLNYPLPFSDGDFDVIACVNVLYAVDKPTFLLQELRRVLREGGRLVLVTPISQPRMSRIFAEHVRLLSKQNPKAWPVILLGQMIRLAPSLVIFTVANRSIQNNPMFHFFKEDELRKTLIESGFRVSSLEKVYGDQAWLMVGQKEEI